MKKWLPLLVFWTCLPGLLVPSASAAPIRPVGPLDVRGTISELRWVPERPVKGTPGLSGSLGRDRVEAAHFLVKLIHYEGVPPETARIMTYYLDESALRNSPAGGQPSFILLKIESKDPDALQPGQRIRVRGYKVAGDEGGTWTSYSDIILLQER
jgi:hypothetical protein